MNTIDQITYQTRAGSGIIIQTATSIRDRLQLEHWRRRLEPWTRIGDPRGCAYLDFGSEAAFIRWQAESASQLQWQQALVLVGPSDRLTGTYALELPALARLGDLTGGSAVPTLDGGAGPRHDAVEALARSADAVEALIPLLADALAGQRHMVRPWSGSALAEAIMWGLISVLRMTGDSRPVSFLTYGSAPSRNGDTPGMLVSFRPDLALPLPPDPGFAALAANLARKFADDPAELRRIFAEHGIGKAADSGDRIRRLLTLAADGHAVPATPSVICPLCLTEILDWDALGYWRYSNSIGDYEKLVIPQEISPAQRARFVRGAYVRCPAPQSGTTAVHYLPARYGRFGKPVLLGFVGLTGSGKSHLLASMISGVGGLSDCGIVVEPLEPARHHWFLENSVVPLITQHKVLPSTRDDATASMADAFIVRNSDGLERVVTLFDISGGDLVQTGSTAEFLWIADGLFFVIDPEHIKASNVGDDTFRNVLNVLRDRPKRPVSAAIVLSKADLVRFEEPADRWLWPKEKESALLDSLEFLRESADVFSYLKEHGAGVLAEPYAVCDKATLHFTSPTGAAYTGDDGFYPRGVTPRRVLRPLVAMLAMTGILTGPEAEKVGVLP